MIEPAHGDLLKSDAEALVNTVNCHGVMGKGIALQFRHAFSENYRRYKAECAKGAVKPGHMLVVPAGLPTNPQYIINFPTKRHWRDPSRIEDIESGLMALIEVVGNLEICSVAVPPLGGGLGGLAWRQVRPMIVSAFTSAPDVRVLPYEPEGQIEAVPRTAQ